MRYQYIFRGTVHPERVDLTIGQRILFRSNFPQLSGDGQIEIKQSKITISILSESKLSSDQTNVIETAKNAVCQAIYTVVDTFCFVKSLSYDVELEWLDCVELALHYQFGVQGEWNINPNEESSKVYFTKLLIVLSDERFRFLADSLADFRRAIKYPSITASHCYRALETIRRSYFDLGDSEKSRVRDTGWGSLRQKFSLATNSFDEILRFAVPNRHGSYPEISYEERERIMNFTRDIINKMVALAIEQIPDFPQSFITDSQIANQCDARTPHLS